MTTSVTIDAHAGWPVAVTQLLGEPGMPQAVQTTIVEPGTKQTFYIHSGMHLIDVRELTPPMRSAGGNVRDVSQEELSGLASQPAGV